MSKGPSDLKHQLGNFQFILQDASGGNTFEGSGQV